jgi:hypothetical protein
MEKLAIIDANQLSCLCRIAEGSSDEGEYFVKQALDAGNSARSAAYSIHANNTFCKVFNIEKYELQVLVNKSYEPDEESPYSFTVETRIKDLGGAIIFTHAFDDVAERNIAFLEFDEDKALKFLDSIPNLKSF